MQKIWKLSDWSRVTQQEHIGICTCVMLFKINEASLSDQSSLVITQRHHLRRENVVVEVNW